MTTLLEQQEIDEYFERNGRMPPKKGNQVMLTAKDIKEMHYENLPPERPRSTNIIKQSPSPLATNKNDLCWYCIQTNSKYTLKGHDTDVWSTGRFQQWLINQLDVYAVVVTTKGQVTVVSANHISFEPERPE